LLVLAAVAGPGAEEGDDEADDAGDPVAAGVRTSMAAKPSSRMKMKTSVPREAWTAFPGRETWVSAVPSHMDPPTTSATPMTMPAVDAAGLSRKAVTKWKVLLLGMVRPLGARDGD
jgi:hypothetical protein